MFIVYMETKMATAVIDLTNSGAKLEFSGSSDEDIAFAKTFWQSVQLFPPLESRLVSSDIHQRLRKAPPGTQSVNVVAEADDPKKLREFMVRAELETKAAEMTRNAKLTELRYADKALLHKHRHKRIQKEAISRSVSNVHKKDNSQEEYDGVGDVEDAMAEIEKFEAGKLNVLQSEQTDSD